MSGQSIILFFTLFIYILVLIIFDKARKKYAGGKVGEVVNLILLTAVLFFVADYILLLAPYIEQSTLNMTQSLIRAAALGVLGFGGARLIR